MEKDNETMKGNLISKIESIIENEKFRLDAYFLCGAAATPPNDKMRKVCEKYLESARAGESDETAKAAMLAEIENVLNTEPAIKVRGDMTDNRNTLREVWDNREYL